MKVHISPFDGHLSVNKYEIDFEGGIKVGLTNYGASITSIWTPNANGRREDVVLGFDSLEEYMNDHPYFGCTCGRYANRIRNGQFELDGEVYCLERNSFPNHLHGGGKGFDKRIWKETGVEEVEGKVYVNFEYVSPHLEEGYPGELIVKVCYAISHSHIEIIYDGQTDKTTIINPTNHTYFNLSGKLGVSVFESHRLEINADRYLPVNEYQIPTGQLVQVDQTDFDFRQMQDLKLPLSEGELTGYDHCFDLGNNSNSKNFAARLDEVSSGRSLMVKTSEPGIQLYTGNNLDGSLRGKGFTFNQHSGVCLETQHFPDSPNILDFDSTILKPGEVFESRTIYGFSAFSP